MLSIKNPKQETLYCFLNEMASARAGFALITPASRGIGFAMARQLLVNTDIPVCATARKDCGAVHDKLVKSVDSQRDAAKRLTVLEADVTSKPDPKNSFSLQCFVSKCNNSNKLLR